MWARTAQQGERSISITQGAAARRATTASATPSTVTAAALSGLFLLLLGAGLATAAPAHAVDDPTRPDARVTHGPSCRPGGLVVEVKAGTAPYFVRLATTRQPSGEDQASVAPGTTVTLRTDDVAWGETIDGRLEFTARDGSGVTFVDELENYSFTRPTREDCDAALAPTQPHPSPSPAPSPSPSAGSEQPGAGSAPSSAPSSGPSRTPAESSPEPTGRPQDSDPGAAAAGPPSSGSVSASSVAPGDTVTVEGAGFLPGERVVVQLRGGAVLASATARADGSVSTEIRIPERTGSGPATVDLVGDDSAVVADVALQVAGLQTPTEADDAGTLVPLVAAAGALVAAVAGFVRVAGRRPTISGGRRGR